MFRENENNEHVNKQKTYNVENLSIILDNNNFFDIEINDEKKFVAFSKKHDQYNF